MVNVFQLSFDEWVLNIQDSLSHLVVQCHAHIKVLKVLPVSLILLEDFSSTLWDDTVWTILLLQVLHFTQKTNQLSWKQSCNVHVQVYYTCKYMFVS